MCADARTQKKLVVLVDMDDTLAYFEKHFLAKFREKYSNEPYVRCKDRNIFYTEEQYEKLPGAAKNIKEKVQSIIKAKGFFLDLPPIDGAIVALKDMAKMQGVDVFIVSYPLLEVCEHSAIEKYEWIEKHFGKEWLEKVILTKDKTVVKGDLLIEDRIDMTGTIKNPSWQHIVFTACHNRKKNLHGLIRLDSWSEEKWRPLIEHFKRKLSSNSST